MTPEPLILGIESSCDETAAAVLLGPRVLSNIIATQEVHAQWGGVVPELASRAHQEHIVPVIHEALRSAGVTPDQLDAIAFTQGPGLIGALLVGTCFARSMAHALNIPLIAVDHLKAHVLAHFISDKEGAVLPAFPFLNLTVSGGHTMIVLVNSPLDMEVLGSTVDDAAGEAFDKGAKILGLPYPGGPEVDKLAEQGTARFDLPFPAVGGLDMSFSGLKTAFMNLVRDRQRELGDTWMQEIPDLCASLRSAVVRILLSKLTKAADRTGATHVGISGGVSANRLLRRALLEKAVEQRWTAHIPPFSYCTDNAAMIARAGAFLYAERQFAPLDVLPYARWSPDK